MVMDYESGDLVWEGKVFIKNKANVASRVGCSERGVMYLRKLFKSDKKRSFRRVESEKIRSYLGRDLLYAWQRVEDQELSLGGHNGCCYCIWHENSKRTDKT